MERTYERATGVNKSLQHFTTKELHEELAKRTGATEFVADPHRYFDICVNGTVYSMSGPARILVNQD
ncbi:BC1881 family protein [Brevibacillus sp. HD3.3A]|uniref:BC1881 family protein n=1 Tax=Brevibacillus sp. HD3.3A TaxID=2738979 RepID=UPI00351D2F65|nr:BC1881 family protein [Brevibacillus sp. HD3.3A]